MRLLACLAAVLTLACGQADRGLRLATTTSVDNSGLLEAILPSFLSGSNVDVQVLAVGSGRALELLRSRDVDAALTHDPDAEAAFLSRAPSTRYAKIMFNDFLIAGPAGDPAGVRGLGTTADAMRRIARSASPFASRGDESGTHARERQLWRAAGVAPPGDRLLETGQGMAATLRVAEERRAYTLTDRATFMQLRGTLTLEPVFEGAADLLNTYAMLVPAASPREADAMALMNWLTDGGGRSAIASFAINGAQPFVVWPPDHPRDTPAATPR